MANLSPRFLFSNGVVSQPANTPITSFLPTHPAPVIQFFEIKSTPTLLNCQLQIIKNHRAFRYTVHYPLEDL
ncbi:hypothetical protein ACE6H2_015121 [Prunus campanulata]